MTQVLLNLAEKDNDPTLKTTMQHRINTSHGNRSMTTTDNYWKPRTTDDHLQMILAVKTSSNQVTQQTYREMLYSKIARLLNVQDLLAEQGEGSPTKEILQMSQEHLPEIYSIAEYEDRMNWADAILNSDTMGALTRNIIWSLETTEIQVNQQKAIEEAMDEECLMSFLEQL